MKNFSWLQRPILRVPTSAVYVFGGAFGGSGVAELYTTLHHTHSAVWQIAIGDAILIGLGFWLCIWAARQEKRAAKRALADPEMARQFLQEIVSPRVEILK